MLPYPRPWFDAWLESAYGTEGFWRRNQPRGHFRTGSGLGAHLAEAIAAWLDQRPAIKTVVEIGAGDGDLLRELARIRPRLRLHGVDLRSAPTGLPNRVDWVVDEWDPRTDRWSHDRVPPLLTGSAGPVLVLGVEWLDDLPCPVVQAGSDGWHELVVDAAGGEHPGAPLTGAEREWTRTWWPSGTRAEVGTTRDRAWTALLTGLGPAGGSVLMVDYGHHAGGRPDQGSLTGYRDGRAVPARPSIETNLTAAVAVDAVRAAGEAAGAWTEIDGPQADVLAGLTDGTPPSDPLTELVHRSQRAALTNPGVWGAHQWLLQSVRPSGGLRGFSLEADPAVPA